MHLFIAGSLTFAKELLALQRFYHQHGHQAMVCDDCPLFAAEPDRKLSFDEQLREGIRKDVLREGFEKIRQADLLLVANYEKRGIQGYIGPSVLMEMGVQYADRKPMAVLFEPLKEQPSGLEIYLMQPTILYGNPEQLLFHLKRLEISRYNI